MQCRIWESGATTRAYWCRFGDVLVHGNVGMIIADYMAALITLGVVEIDRFSVASVITCIVAVWVGNKIR